MLDVINDFLSSRVLIPFVLGLGVISRFDQDLFNCDTSPICSAFYAVAGAQAAII